MQELQSKRGLGRLLLFLAILIVSGIVSGLMLLLFLFESGGLSIEAVVFGWTAMAAILYLIFAVRSLKYNISKAFSKLGKNMLASAPVSFLITLSAENHWGINLLTGMDCQRMQVYVTTALSVCPVGYYWDGFSYLITIIFPLFFFATLIGASVFSSCYTWRIRSSQARLNTPILSE